MLDRIEKMRKCHLRLCEMGDKLCLIFQRLLVVQYPMILLDMVQGMFYATLTFFGVLDDNEISKYIY